MNCEKIYCRMLFWTVFLAGWSRENFIPHELLHKICEILFEESKDLRSNIMCGLFSKGKTWCRIALRNMYLQRDVKSIPLRFRQKFNSEQDHTFPIHLSVWPYLKCLGQKYCSLKRGAICPNVRMSYKDMNLCILWLAMPSICHPNFVK